MANIKISEMTPAANASGTQEYEVNESGTTKKVTGAQISAYVRGTVTLGDLGITATDTELNYVDGVTSSIQTQLDAKAAVDNPTFTTGITSPQVDITAQGDLRLQDSSGGQYVALQAPATISSNYTLTMPTADGSANQVLTTDGSGSLSFADASGGGAWSLVSSATASNDASLEFSFQSGAAQHAFVFSQLIPYTNATQLRAQMRNQSTESYSTATGDYSWRFLYSHASSTTLNNLRGESVSYLTFLYNVSNSSAGGGISGVVYFDDPFVTYDSTCTWNLSSSYSTGLYANHGVGAGAKMENGAHDRVKFYMSGGDLVSGTIYYYALSSS